MWAVGSFQSYMIQNVGTNIFIIAVEFKIGIAQNSEAERGKIGIAFPVIRFGDFLIVLCPIQLNNQSALGTIKIYDIISDGFLSAKVYGQGPQKIKPQFSFFFRRSPTQVIGTFRKFGVVKFSCFLHTPIPPIRHSRSSCHPPPQRGRASVRKHNDAYVPHV